MLTALWMFLVFSPAYLTSKFWSYELFFESKNLITSFYWVFVIFSISIDKELFYVSRSNTNLNYVNLFMGKFESDFIYKHNPYTSSSKVI